LVPSSLVRSRARDGDVVHDVAFPAVESSSVVHDALAPLRELIATDPCITAARHPPPRAGRGPPAGATARGTFGRFEPGASPWATLLYALRPTYVRVDAFEDAADPLSSPASSTTMPSPGWTRSCEIVPTP
jgi:hypothetical protein